MNPGVPDSPLSARDLIVGYENTPVVRDLDLAVHAGEFVCLLGPNGAGKSTLIRTLAGMQPPLSGELTLNGRNFATFHPRERARLISVVLTEALPAGIMDAYSLVSLGRHPYSGWLGGLSDRDRARIEWAFEAVNAAALARRQVGELSDGERQKISIARALAQETRVMLLDEPTAFLDLPRRVELMTILRDLAHQQNMALLLSTHDLDLALRFADRLWIMTSEGHLIQGYPEELALNGEFARAFRSERLEWDAELGSFRTQRVPCLTVRLEGAGLSALWTRRALARLGFGIADTSETPAFSVQVEDASDVTQWHVAHREETVRFDSLRGLIEWISNRQWTLPPDDPGVVPPAG